MCLKENPSYKNLYYFNIICRGEYICFICIYKTLRIIYLHKILLEYDIQCFSILMTFYKTCYHSNKQMPCNICK